MLKPLTANLLDDLNESQKAFLVSMLEKNNILETGVETFPTNVILDPGGKALLKLENEKIAPQDIYDVMSILQNVINMAIKSFKPSWLNDNKLLIQRPEIMVESETPSIVFKVVDGKPGAAGTGPVNSPVRRMVTSILKGRYIDPKDRASEVYLYGQRFDYNINLSIYAKTAHEADILKEWIADIIRTYIWYVRYSGVLDFTFVQELSDDMESTRQKRTLQYAVSIEKLTWSSFFILKQIAIELSTSS
jgi:hypothetical protein